MQGINEIAKHIFQIESDGQFNDLAMEVFRFQAINNPVYSKYLQLLKIPYRDVKSIQEVPFLPISLFKSERVLIDGYLPELQFKSSGITSKNRSIHHVVDSRLYKDSFLKGFEFFYGHPQEWTFLALLPNYIAQGDSSLVYMVNELIQSSGDKDSGFFLDDLEEISGILRSKNREKKKTLLIGVSYALLDLAEQFPGDYSSITIMETGGMKGRRREMIRPELHEILQESFKAHEIHSEYGMTELLSQAYSRGNGHFSCPPWMKIRIRDPRDPFSGLVEGQSGGVDVIDLANLYSCSFISTQDLGKIVPNGQFEILGRFDDSDVRGCNLMVI